MALNEKIAGIFKVELGEHERSELLEDFKAADKEVHRVELALVSTV